MGTLQDIIFLGYPIGLWDSKNNLPITRKGVTATNPQIDYEGKKEFLIDAACFPGSNGSPVFRFNEGAYIENSSFIAGGGQINFLGIIYAGPQYTVEGTIIVKNIPTKLEPRSNSDIPVNLGFVLKADLFTDFEPILKQIMQFDEKKGESEN